MALPPITRSVTPPQTQAVRPIGDTRTAAQRAFFDAALQRAKAPAPSAAAASVQTAPAAIRTRAPAPIDAGGDARSQPLRPGSLVNILV
jgi:hypothetical protein